jgi:hypothetical protein
MTDTVVPFRPAALPALGYRVDVHQHGAVTLVILFQNRLIAYQRTFGSSEDAEAFARDLAADHRCAVIHHTPNHRKVNRCALQAARERTDG